MKMMALLCVLFLAACVRAPSVSPSEAEALGKVAQLLLTHDPGAEVPSDDWPQAISALSPKSVRVAAEGAYIETSSWFVEEAGVFLPRDPKTFAPVSGSDPEYERIHDAVFSYRIRG